MQSSRWWHVFLRLLLAGALSLVVGSVISAMVMLPVIALKYNSELRICKELFSAFAMLVVGSAFWGGMLLFWVTLIAVLPVLYFSGYRPSPLRLIFTAAIAGALVVLLRSVFSLHEEFFSDTPSLRSEDRYNWRVLQTSLSAAGGTLYGALYGAWYSLSERWRRSDARSADESIFLAATPKRAPLKPGGWWICGLAICAGVFLPWYHGIPTGDIVAARRAALQHQDALLDEARILLDEAANLENGVMSHIVGENALKLKHVAAIGGDYVTASASKAAAGTVKVKISGSHGLFIVPEPTSVTLQMVRSDYALDGRFGYLKVVNDHIYQYYREEH